MGLCPRCTGCALPGESLTQEPLVFVNRKVTRVEQSLRKKEKACGEWIGWKRDPGQWPVEEASGGRHQLSEVTCGSMTITGKPAVCAGKCPHTGCPMHKPCGSGAARGCKALQCDLGEHGHQDPGQGRGAPSPRISMGWPAGLTSCSAPLGTLSPPGGKLAREEEETRASE